MSHWKIFVFVIVLGSTAFSRAETPKAQDDPKIQSVQSIINHVKLQSADFPIRLFAQGRKLTVNVITPSEPIKAHYHATHEEVVYIVKGQGKMTLGDKTQDVKEGDIIFIPRKTLHSFLPEGGDCRIISIFAPAFDGRDRIFLKEDKKN